MIVTVSNEYGSGALEIAQRVAEELGYAYVDRQLPIVVAKRLHVAAETVEANEETSQTLGGRFLIGLERATPELAAASAAQPFDRELLRAVQEAVREYASLGDCVIVGRGASAILGARPDVLRVFIRAPREWRIGHVVETMHTQRAIAETELDRVDRARSAHMREWYGLTLGDPENYDLCIDASRLGVKDSASLIVTAVRARAA